MCVLTMQFLAEDWCIESQMSLQRGLQILFKIRPREIKNSKKS